MKIKALVVDNNPVLLRAVSAILKQEGCDVMTADTGLAALETLEDFLPDIVFTDLIMPLVSGEQLCRVLRNTDKYQNIFIVVLSAIVLEDKERIQREIACDLCIAKGDLKEIRSHLQEALTAYRSYSSALHDHTHRLTRIPAGLKPSEVTSELLLEKQHSATILANLEEGILELSEQGKVVTVNTAALNILGIPEEKLIGSWFGQMIDWGDFRMPVEMWANAQLTKQGMRSFLIGEEKPLKVNNRVVTASFTPVRERKSVFGLCIFRDITRQFVAEKYKREIDDAIKLVKKMDAMSCMAGGVAHDFNNLLTVICGNLDIITMFADRQTVGERMKLVEQARKAAMAAVDLTRQISGFSNFGIISRKTVNFGRLIEGAVNAFFRENGEMGTFTCKGDIGDVSVDEEQISQAVANVLQNALEASFSRPAINVMVEQLTFEKPQLMSGQYVPAGQYAHAVFRDSGTGIEQENLLRIFDPYYSTKERGALKGMGLGLAIVYSTLRNHGGYVVVSSKSGKGTEVSFYLPVVPRFQAGDGLAQDGAIPQNVVVMESDHPMQEIAKVMLTHLGYTVTVVNNGDELLSEVARILDTGLTKRSLVVLVEISELDIESASELCHSLKSLAPGVTIVGMSGTIIGPLMENCQNLGFAGALSKPYTMDSLKHVLSSALTRSI